MADFIIGMITTWVHIISGVSIVGILLFVTLIISRIYFIYIDKKEETEMEKMRNAMNKRGAN